MIFASAKIDHAGFFLPAKHNLTIVSKALVISDSRAILADVQVQGHEGFAMVHYKQENPFPKTSGIYQIRCLVNNQIYIGSAINLYTRKVHHQMYLRKNSHQSKYLQASFNKYGGFHCLEFSILEYCEKEKLIEREQHYLDILSPAFNNCKIAQSSLGTKCSDETKKKISIANTGKTASEETRKKISISSKGRIILNPRRGFKHSEETRMKISVSHKGKRFSQDHINHMMEGKGIPVAQVDLKTGDVIKIFRSTKEAERETGIGHRSISNVARRKYKHKTAGGYFWTYELDNIHIEKKNPGKKIEQFDLNTGETIAVFLSISDAARFFGTNATSISRTLNMKQKSALGYGWRELR